MVYLESPRLIYQYKLIGRISAALIEHGMGAQLRLLIAFRGYIVVDGDR